MLIQTVVWSLPALFNVGSVIFLLMFIYVSTKILCSWEHGVLGVAASYIPRIHSVLYYAISTFECNAFHNQASNRLVVDVYIIYEYLGVPDI